ncbi:TIGR00282 family metallophosphoesterase [Cerasicoccus fimbriatus]|uniref:TIGR00282 family metallophosphoesterase n=1 Tax=Cerasicoccus fimbriatus TaxID=3014554 RepID=UPI0022B41FCB|nr:TIGR00282 family metallophosphoesterase [Cerasicoccus sp. TK19100]
MRILFIGDIVGKPGRNFVKAQLKVLREELELDFVVANGENAAAGSGITGAIAGEILDAGVDGITLGDHVWDQRGFVDEIDSLRSVCRPANLPAENPGRTHLILESNGFKLGVFTVLGRTFMKTNADCPFRCADHQIGELHAQCDAILAEIHAETTSEKVAMGWYLDGRAQMVVGTHTHIPTGDATILTRGTAYHTDAGMTGPYESILGREIQPIVLRFLDGLPRVWPVASNDVRICGTLVDIDVEQGIATKCEQFTLRAR